MSIDQQAKMWNDRYSMSEYVYGQEPNVYFKEKISDLKPGAALFPAEGEGRNAVYAASLGWEVIAFDLSEEGKKKAQKLAKQNNVNIDYKTGDYNTHNYQSESFDLLVFIFAHFSGTEKIKIHHDLNQLLKSGGWVIFEAFSKSHIANQALYPKIGGPKDLQMLWSESEILEAFPGFEIIQLEETEIELKEGDFHEGIGSVIRFIGKKN